MNELVQKLVHFFQTAPIAPEASAWPGSSKPRAGVWQELAKEV